MTESHLSELRFDSLELHDSLRRGIADAGFEYCTPIQADTLPIALSGKDVAGQAQTGTGKTAAFLIAAYQHVLSKQADEAPAADAGAGEERADEQRQPRIFILAPTRELAIQIAKDAEVLGRHTGLKIALAYGGTGYEQQRRTIQDGIDILIGTPGRIIDYFKQGVFKLNQVQVAILDEADRMFDLGFIKDIRYLLRRLPKPDQRLNMLFSATLSHRVMELAYEHMNEPELIEIEPDKVTADRVRQAIFFPSNEEKVPLLVGLIREMGSSRIMVFVNTKREAERIEAYLQGNDIDAMAISGDVPQNKRQRMLKQLPERRARRTDRYRRRFARICIFRTSSTSSTTTCRRIARITCTGSAGRRGPVLRAMRSASAARPTRWYCRKSRNTSGTRYRSPTTTPSCSRS